MEILNGAAVAVLAIAALCGCYWLSGMAQNPSSRWRWLLLVVWVAMIAGSAFRIYVYYDEESDGAKARFALAPILQAVERGDQNGMVYWIMQAQRSNSAARTQSR